MIHSYKVGGKPYGLRSVIPQSCMNILGATMGMEVGFEIRGKVARLVVGTGIDGSRISHVGKDTWRITIPSRVSKRLSITEKDKLVWFVSCCKSAINVEVEKK